jgi:hypothetical protein
LGEERFLQKDGLRNWDMKNFMGKKTKHEINEIQTRDEHEHMLFFKYFNIHYVLYMYYMI